MFIMAFNKAVKRLVGLLGAGALALGLGGKADAYEIKITNFTSNTNYNNSSFYAFGEQGGPNDNFDAWDVSFLASPSPALQIYSNVWDPVSQSYMKLREDHRDWNTFGWDFYLGVNQGDSLTGDNSLKFKVLDATAIGDPIQILAYDTLTPSVKYTIPKDGSILIVPLPALVGETNNPYAHWRADRDLIVNSGQTYTLDNVVVKDAIINGDLTVTSVFGDTFTMGTGSTLTIAPIPGGLQANYGGVNPIPEPSTIALLCMAGLIGAGFGAYSRKRRVIF
jgi:hypothetical protein